MAKNLSLLSDGSDSESEFKINKKYAENYSKWRNLEERQKLKSRGIDISDSNSSSESEDEVPEIEEDFFRTLSMLKSKDPKIYDKNVSFFNDNDKTKSETPKVKKTKPLFLKDYEKKMVSEGHGAESDDEDHMLSVGPSFSEEQEELKRGFKEALNDSTDDDEENSGFLKVKQKTKTEQEAEEADYLRWFKGQKAKVSKKKKKEMECLHNYWNDNKIDEGEQFLKDYILNKKFLDEDKPKGVPSYDEIINDFTDDEEIVAQQEQFEHKYNFRFEEPDQEFIKRYPKIIDDSLRKTDNKRRLQRESYAERKKKEKEQMREELKRLKAIKRKEIEEKFVKIKEISGFNDLNMNELDLEDDFDPEEHDKKMKELFDDEYYAVKEKKKPDLPCDEDLEIENWDDWTGNNDADICYLNSNFQNNEIVDDSPDYEVKFDPKKEFQSEVMEAIHGGRKRKRKKSLFAELLSKSKPVYDSTGKSFQEYLNEYYQLDYEDIIGNKPVRFKYRNVLPNDFGLSVGEVLTAEDKELNQWCSVRKAIQYRDMDEELHDVKAYQRKARKFKVKQKILQSVYAEPDPDEANLQFEITEKQKSGKSKNIKDQRKERSEVSQVKKKKAKHSKDGTADSTINEISVPSYDEIDSQHQIIRDNEDDVRSDFKGSKAMKKKKIIVKEDNSSFEFEMNADVDNSFHAISNIADGNVSLNESHSKQKKKSTKRKNKPEKENPVPEFSHYSETSRITEDISSHKKIKTIGIFDSTDEKSYGNKHNESTSKYTPDRSICNSTLNFDVVNNSEDITSSKKQRKRKRKKSSSAKNNISSSVKNDMPKSETLHKQKNKNNFDNSVKRDNQLSIPDRRLEAYGIKPNQFRRLEKEKFYKSNAKK